MKKSILLTLSIAVLIVCIILSTIATIKANRRNLINNSSFNLSLGKTGYGWTKLLPINSEKLSVSSENGDNFAIVDTIGILDEERNPFTNQAIGQNVELQGGDKTYSLSGRIRKESRDGIALAQLRLHGAYSKSFSDSFRLESEKGKWIDFSITVTSSDPVLSADVVLGFYGQGVGYYDDLVLVEGEKLGGEYISLAKYLGIILLAYICGFAMIELFISNSIGNTDESRD